MGRAIAAGWTAVAGLAILLGSAAAGRAVERSADSVKPRPIRSLVFSPDGKSLAAAYGSAPRTGELVVWDVEKRELRFAYTETVPILSVAYSPKGDLLAIGTFRNNAKLLDPATGEVRRELVGHEGTVRCVAFSPDGKWLATGSYDTTVRLWDVASGEARRVLKGSQPLRWVGFSPDGKWLASIAPREHQLKLRRTAALDKPPREIDVKTESLHAAFSPDSRKLAVADAHGALLVYDVDKDGDPERVDNMTALHWVAYSPDGKWLAGAPAALGVFVDHPDKRRAEGTRQVEIGALIEQLGDDDLSRREAASQRLAAFGDTAAEPIRAAANSPDAEVRDRCRILIELMQKGDFSEGISDLQAIPECLAFSPDSRLLACGDWHGGIRIWREGRWNDSVKLDREHLGPPTKLVSEYGIARGLFPPGRPQPQPQSQLPQLPPFALPHPSINTLDAIEEFRAALKEETWEKAFGHLEKLATDSSLTLVPEKDGFQLPLRATLFASLVRMPAAGKNAYRLFHDAEARGLWERAQNEEGAAEFEILSRLATIELHTSVGDLGADRLGDVLFEQGDMDGAISAWQRILEWRPDSTLRPVELLIKIATAMTRAGRWKEAAEVKRLIEARYAGESITVGGKKVLSTDYLARLESPRPESDDESAAAEPSDLVLPSTDEPLWQFRYSNPAKQVIINTGAGLMVQNQNGPAVDQGPPAVVAQDHLFATVLGSDFCLDLESGKIVWTTRRFDAASRNRQYWQSSRSGLMVQGNELWTTAPVVATPVGVRFMGAGFSNLLIRRDLASGKEVWTSGNVEGLKAWAPMGAPLLAADKLYLLARRQNQFTDVYVLAMQISDGRLLWSTAIGTYQTDPRRGMVFPPSPILTLRGTRLYVDTQTGGIMQIQADTGAIRWACLDDPETYRDNVQARMQGQPRIASPDFNFSVPLVEGGLLFVKRKDSTDLSAIRVGEPAMAWKRSAPYGSIPSAVDHKRLYLAGDEILAYDLRTQKLLWNSRPPATTSWVQPLLTQHRYYQLTAGGVVELDKATGKIENVFKGADPGATGGKILVTPKLLITVSDHAITAYPLGRRSPD